MFVRAVLRRLAVPVVGVAILGPIAAVSLATPAFASGPANASNVPNSVVPDETYTAGTPFSSGQLVNIEVPANSNLTPGAAVHILECADAGGVPAGNPTSVSQCDGNTVDLNGVTNYVNSDGSVNITGYPIYALPDKHTLGETSSNGAVCNLSNPCVFFIGQNYTSFSSAPYYLSQPFLVSPNSTDSGADPGDGTPETPLAIGLPLLAMGIAGGTLFFRRRRSPASTKA